MQEIDLLSKSHDKGKKVSSPVLHYILVFYSMGFLYLSEE